MKIIQCIGSPCSGKSTFLKRFVKENPIWKLYDIVDYRYDSFDWLLAENKLLNQVIQSDSEFVLLESAQGFHDIKSYNIEFRCDIPTLIQRHVLRGLELTDEELKYYALLKSIGIQAHFILDTSGEITYTHLLNQFFKAIEVALQHPINH